MTETGLDDRIYSQQLFSPSYIVYRCDRSPANSSKSRFGGVLISIAQQYASRVVHTGNGRNLEQVCVSSTIKGRKVSFRVVYITSDKNKDATIIIEQLSKNCVVTVLTVTQFWFVVITINHICVGV